MQPYVRSRHGQPKKAAACGVKKIEDKHVMEADELRSHIVEKAKTSSLPWKQRLNVALSAVGDIPEHLGDAFHVKATSLADDIQGEVAAVNHSIWRSDALCKESMERVAELLDNIPTMILNAFEDSFSKSKGALRKRIAKLTLRLENTGLKREQIVDQLWAIPEEVRQIAATAAEEALHTAHQQLTKMLDDALWFVPEPSALHPQMLEVKEQINARVPSMFSHAVRAATDAARVNIEHAVAAVQNDEEQQQAVLNKVVADAILRAKTGQLDESRPRHHEKETLDIASDLVVGSWDGTDETRDRHRKFRGARATAPKIFPRRPGSAVSVSTPQQWQGMDSVSDCPLLYVPVQDAPISVDTDSVSANSAPATLLSQSNLFRLRPDECEQRLSVALQAIDAIPEQLGVVLQAKAVNLANDVKGALTAAQQVIKYEEAYEDYANDMMHSLDTIPVMILSAFEYRFSKVTSDVRHRVNMMMNEVKDTNLDSDQSSQQIVRQLLTIPEEVQQIASVAVEQAVQESKAQATKQIDYVMVNFGEEHSTATVLSNAKLDIMERVPDAYSEALKAARATAATNVLHAVEAVDVTNNEVPGPIPAPPQIPAFREASGAPPDVGQPHANLRFTAPPERTGSSSSREAPRRQVHRGRQQEECRKVASMSSMLADEDLDAGATGSLQCLQSAASGAAMDNPGSQGHPELCPRPCLYFSMGQCKGGSNCDFCHMPHPKRPAHLDRSRREILKSLPTQKRFDLILPILRAKVKTLSMSMEVIDSLQEFAAKHREAEERSGVQVINPSAKDEKMLVRALRNMTVRALLATLLRTVETSAAEDNDETFTIDRILQRLRQEVVTRGSSR